MKRFLVVLLALGLIVAFSAPAVAADVKFSGSYDVWGYYEDHETLIKDTGASDQFYAQRLRIKTVFQVAEGLKLTTRFDAMERVWGGSRVDTSSTYDNEKNISWERAYVTFNTLGGQFDVGYMSGGVFGTAFADEVRNCPRIKYTYVNGPYKLLAIIEKATESDIGTDTSDNDKDYYMLAPIYKWDGGNAGLLAVYYNDATTSSDGYKGRYYKLDPYFKATFGPVYVEGEFLWLFGEKKQYEQAGNKDVDYDGKSAYIMAKVNLGQFYVGGQFAYVSGDDQATTDDESGPSGRDYNPCLILFGDDKLYKWKATDKDNNGLGSAATGTTGDQMDNALLYQAFAGFKPIEKLQMTASVTFAKADEKREASINHVDDDYGTELDVTATYKIYDNLSYMVGFGYLWAGDWYKGADSTTKVEDDYLLMNKLTLKF